MDPGHLMRTDLQRNIVEDLFFFIGKRYLCQLQIPVADLTSFPVFFYERLFFQQLQDPLSAGQRILQGHAQIGQCRDRPERRQQRHKAKQYACGRNHALLMQQAAKPQHEQAERVDHRAGQRTSLAALDAQLPFTFGKLLALMTDRIQPRLPIRILQRLCQTA